MVLTPAIPDMMSPRGEPFKSGSDSAREEREVTEETGVEKDETEGENDGVAAFPAYFGLIDRMLPDNASLFAMNLLVYCKVEVEKEQGL